MKCRQAMIDPRPTSKAERGESRSFVHEDDDGDRTNSAVSANRSGALPADRSALTGDGQLRRRERTNRRRRRVPALDLDQRGERARPLRERRGADVERKHVGIAVPLGRSRRIVGIEPSARCHDHDTRHHARVNDRAREAGAAGVEHAHDVAVADAALRSVWRIDTDGFAALDLLAARYRPR